MWWISWFGLAVIELLAYRSSDKDNINMEEEARQRIHSRFSKLLMDPVFEPICG